MTIKTSKRLAGPEVIKLFFMLNLAEHDFFPAHNVEMSTTVGTVTFISRKNNILSLHEHVSKAEKC